MTWLAKSMTGEWKRQEGIGSEQRLTLEGTRPWLEVAQALVACGQEAEKTVAHLAMLPLDRHNYPERK